MRMTSTGAFPRALAAARPPKPPPTMTTRGVRGFCPSPCPFELRIESLIYLFLKLLSPEISENLRDLAPACHSAPAGPEFFRRAQLFVEQLGLRRREFFHFFLVNFRVP